MQGTHFSNFFVRAIILVCDRYFALKISDIVKKYLSYLESFGRAFLRWLFHVVQGLKVDEYFWVNLEFSSNKRANLT